MYWLWEKCSAGISEKRVYYSGSRSISVLTFRFHGQCGKEASHATHQGGPTRFRTVTQAITVIHFSCARSKILCKILVRMLNRKTINYRYGYGQHDAISFLDSRNLRESTWFEALVGDSNWWWPYFDVVQRLRVKCEMCHLRRQFFPTNEIGTQRVDSTW